MTDFKQIKNLITKLPINDTKFNIEKHNLYQKKIMSIKSGFILYTVPVRENFENICI